MDDPCNRCVRRDFPMYLGIYAAVPKEAAPARPALSGNFGGGVTDKALTESVYVLRSPEPGYVYMLCGQAWRGYLIDAAGYPNYYGNLRIEDMPNAVPAESKPAQCERTGKKHTGIEAICIEFPELITGPVYIAYSRHKWTKAVRAEIAKNPAKHMKQVVHLDGQPFAHAEVASVENLRKWVIDFDANAVRAVNKHLPEGAQVQDRSAKAEGIVKAMLANSGALKTPGVIMALHDDVGITAMLNHGRNAVVEQVLLLDQKTPETERDDMLVAGVIEDLREGMQKGGGDWERHAKHIDQPKLDAAKKKLEQRRKLAFRVDALSADYVAWMTAPPTQSVFKSQFDPVDIASCFSLEAWFAACTMGSGTTKLERDKVWQPWFDQQPEHPDNLLWQAATANDGDVLKYITWLKVDKTFDAAKGAKDVFKETPWYEHAQEALAGRAQRKGQQRAYTLATEKIAQTLAAQLMWLRSRDQKKFLRTAAQMATVLMVRGDMVMLPKTLTARMSQYIRWQQEAWLGKPTVKAPLRIEPMANRLSPKQVDPSKLANAELRQEVQSLHGALMIDLSGKDGVMAFTAWAAVRLEPGQAPDEAMQKLARQLKLQPKDLSLSADFKLNPLTEGALNVRTARLDRVFSGGTAFVQLISFFNTANELSDELKKGKDADSLKVTTSVAGMLGACATVIAAGMEIKAAGNIVGAGGVAGFGTKVLLGGAASIGLVVGLADAYFLWKNADKLAAEGDEDAAKWTNRAKWMTAGSAVSGFSAAVLGIFFGLTGVGLVVLIVATIGTGIAAMYSSFQAGKTAHTELEKWLDRGRFGKHERPDSKSPFKDLEAEMAGLRSAIYVIGVSIRHMPDTVSMRAFYEAAVPFYMTATRVGLEVWGQDPWGKSHLLTHTEFAGETSLPKENVDHKATASAHMTMQLQEKALRISGEVLVRKPPIDLYRDDKTGYQFINVGGVPMNVSDIVYIQSMRVVVKYQPDTKTWPDFLVEAKA